PVRETTAAIQAKAAHLFTVRPATKWHLGGGNVSSHLRGSTSPNPATGAAIWFQLAKDPTADVRLDILDAKGNVVARAKAAKPKAGPGSDTGGSPEGDDDDEDDKP